DCIIRPLTLLRFCVHHYSDSVFFLTNRSTPQLYTLSLHDALPISRCSMPTPTRWCCWPRWRPSIPAWTGPGRASKRSRTRTGSRSEEHTSELQSRENLVCRLLLEKKKKKCRRQNSSQARHTLHM